MGILLPAIIATTIIFGFCYLVSMIYNVEKKRTYIGICQKTFTIITSLLLIAQLIIRILLSKALFLTIVSIILFLGTFALFSFVSYLYKLEKDYIDASESEDSSNNL